MRLAAAALTVLALAGCSSSSGGTSTSATPPASSASVSAPSTFGIIGTVTLYGVISTGVDSMVQGSPCIGIVNPDLTTEDYEDLSVGATVTALDGSGATVGLGSITSSSMVVVNPPESRQCTFSYEVSGIEAGKGFYSLRIGDHDTEQQSETDFKAGPSFSIKSALYSG